MLNNKSGYLAFVLCLFCFCIFDTRFEISLQIQFMFGYNRFTSGLVGTECFGFVGWLAEIWFYPETDMFFIFISQWRWKQFFIHVAGKMAMLLLHVDLKTITFYGLKNLNSFMFLYTFFVFNKKTFLLLNWKFNCFTYMNK